MGTYLLACGDYAAAVEPFEWSINAIPESQIAERFGLVSIASAVARSALARTLGELLEFDRGRALASEAMAIAERNEHPFTLLYVTQEIGILYLRTGELDEAIRVLSIGHKLAMAMPNNLLRPAVMAELGAALVENGRLEDGIELLKESLDCARSLQLKPQYGQQLGYLARGHLLAGDVDKARRLAREALDCTLTYNERGDEAWIRLLLAEVTGRTDPSEAQRMFADVRRLAERRGYATLVKRCTKLMNGRGVAVSPKLNGGGGHGFSARKDRRVMGAPIGGD